MLVKICVEYGVSEENEDGDEHRVSDGKKLLVI